MSISDTMRKIRTRKGIPVAFGSFREKQAPPYIVYRGGGQTNLPADDTFYHSEPDYQIEYYFREKNEEQETAIEQILLEDGRLYEKSSDIYIEDEKLWAIYYQV